MKSHHVIAFLALSLGAASLVAAWNVEIATLVGIDPIEVHREVVRWIGVASSQGCRRRRTAAVTPSRARPTVVELPSRGTGDRSPALTRILSRPFSIQADVKADPQSVSVDTLSLGLGDIRATGGVLNRQGCAHRIPCCHLPSGGPVSRDRYRAHRRRS